MKTLCIPLLFAAASLSAAAQEKFVPAPEPGTGTHSPATGAEEQARFSLPPGFEIELVASEEEGAGKTVTVAWDDAGRMWAITALEYPLDGNENPEAARALYEKGGRDRVLVFDDPYSAGPRAARVFADGLAMPMGILPYKDGAFVGDGPNVYWMHDTDGDGRADQREILLSGFGVQDSHLMPHQFTRAPGGWFYLAQGAFNYSRVKTRDGQEHRFDQTRLARFTPDGMRFEDVTCGPCNIWGLVIGREGETFIQEANDFGYPVMAYEEGASYPGCSGAFKPYAPYFPSEVEFRMGGTGLSGLALSDPAGSFPGVYADVMFVANPITRKIQAIKIHPEGPWYRYELLGDFVLSSDEWFRPVSIHFGPDGCLYIVDWYNKIISHNEVPRNHPERDKTRGRIWRVRHKDQPRVKVPNVAKAGDDELIDLLRSSSTWLMRAAWHQIADRKLTKLAPALNRIVMDKNEAAPARIQALWAMEDLHALELKTAEKLAAESNRNLRREGIRAAGNAELPGVLEFIGRFISDPDAQVRAEVIRIAARHAGTDLAAMTLLANAIQPSLETPMGRNPQNGAPMKLREAYDREFERYLIRAAFEKIPAQTESFLASEQGKKLPAENRALMLVALPRERGSGELAEVLPRLTRVPNEEELVRLLDSGTEESLAAIRALLGKEEARRAVIEALVKVRLRLDMAKVEPLLEEPLRALWSGSESREFAANAAGALKVHALAPELESVLANANAPKLQLAALRALRELGSGDSGRIAALARAASDPAVKTEALNSVAASRDSALLIEFWPGMNAVQRRSALAQLTRSKSAAADLLAALSDGRIDERDLSSEALEKIRELLPDNKSALELVERLSPQFKPVLRLDGANGSYVDSNLSLEGPFTVETWVKLEPGISNDDGILGVPGGADFNFANGLFRVYCGPELGDRAITHRPVTANSWTHIAVTRDSQGVFRAYVNGEIDATDPRGLTNTFAGLDIGRTTPSRGTAGELTEFRIWNFARGAEEIRADFDRTFAGEPLPSGLTHYFAGAGPWGKLHGGARVEKISDAPALLTGEQARIQGAKFARFRTLAESGGDSEKGRAVFATTCMICHSVAGQGAQIGPVLNGAGASGTEALLRNILTPNAAMEAGYRTFRVELKDGDVIDGFFVSRDDRAIILRQPNSEDRRIPAETVRRAEYIPRSLMPDGLLDNMPAGDVRNLFAYLKTLK